MIIFYGLDNIFSLKIKIKNKKKFELKKRIVVFCSDNNRFQQSYLHWTPNYSVLEHVSSFH